MARNVGFAVCCLVAVLATMFLGVGLVQLWSVWDGGYDPIRDDHQPPDFMPTYYANVLKMMLAATVIAAIAGTIAVQIRPKEIRL
jgi:hypothetical protein